jgi:hypothetical protein
VVPALGESAELSCATAGASGQPIVIIVEPSWLGHDTYCGE